MVDLSAKTMPHAPGSGCTKGLQTDILPTRGSHTLLLVLKTSFAAIVLLTLFSPTFLVRNRCPNTIFCSPVANTWE
jgi:hypothetical protein